jgi:protease I
MENLKGLKVAILIENGFEQVEMTEPRKALLDAGAEVTIVSPQRADVRGWKHTEWGDEFPGGVMNPDKLRMEPKAVAVAKAFFDSDKPVAAICHAPWTVIEAGAAKGKRIASWPSLKTDLQNAGAKWVDEEVVVDGKLVTSRKPDDIPAFNREMLKLFGSARAKAHSAS